MTPDQEKLLIGLCEDMKEVKTGMLGNDYVKGAIPRLNALETRFNKKEAADEAIKNRYKGMVLAISTGWTIFVVFIVELAKQLRPK